MHTFLHKSIESATQFYLYDRMNIYTINNKLCREAGMEEQINKCVKLMAVNLKLLTYVST